MTFSDSTVRTAFPPAAPFAHQLRRLVTGETRLIVRLASVALLSSLVGLAVPYGYRIVLDWALPDGSPSLLWVVALGVVVLAAHQAWLAWLSASTSAALSALVEEKALRGVMRAFLGCDFERLKLRDGGWMTTTLAGASGAVATYVSSFAQLLTQGLFALGYFIALGLAFPGAALLIVVVSLAISGVSLLMSRLENGSILEMLERDSWQRELLHLLLSALPSVRGHFSTEAAADRWGQAATQMGHSARKMSRMGTLMMLTESVGQRLVATGFLIWAVRAAFAGDLSIGQLVFALSVSGGLSSSLAGLVGVWMGLRALRPRFQRVDEVLIGRLHSAGPPNASQPPVPSEVAVVCDNVSFRYPQGDRWAVEDSSREFASGAVHRIEGPSGTGKSTTLRLIAGLHRPTKGRVRVFGVDAVLARQWVLYVPQHCKTFEASIRENLELLSGESWPRIEEVAQLTGADRLLASLPMGLETHLSGQGQNISSGQRQLLVLTAAFASSRPVLLLDEATSQVDAASRARIRWDALARGRTILAVEHG